MNVFIYQFEISLEPEIGVYAEVSLIVDTTNANDIDTSIDEFEAHFNQQWNVELNSVYITSMPSTEPSPLPIISPSSLQPSATPSITGLIITIHVTLIYILSDEFFMRLQVQSLENFLMKILPL